MRPPPEGAAKVDAGGRSPGSRVNASLRPSRSERLQWQVEGRSPLTVAGAAAELGRNPHRVPFYVPHHAGTDDAEDYSRLPALRKGADRRCIDKGGAARLKCLASTVSRMRGTGNAVRAQGPKSAAAPATVSGEPEPNGHWETPGKAAKAETREPGDLPSMLVARRAGCLGAVGSLADWSGSRASAVMHP